MTQFVHLHVHTEYSLVDGLVRIKPLMKAVAAAGMPAVALTDQNNLFALVKFYRAALANGLKPIIGAEIHVAGEEANSPADKLVLLCQNEVGYGNLSRLLSAVYLKGQERGRALLQRHWLIGATDGLIALSGGREGDVGRLLLAGKQTAARARLQHWMDMFPDRFYLELQRTGRADEENYLHAAVSLARQLDCPLVASNDVRFLQQDEFEAHEARVCIHEGRTLADTRRVKQFSDQQYLRSPADMQALFADLPEALENTLEIARRCNFKLTLGEYFLPKFPVPQGQTINDYFAAASRQGLAKRLEKIALAKPLDDEQRQVYVARLEEELDVISQMGFPGYFLIVADFIRWAKRNDVPVGPGRGSGAGSLVAYALEITDLDPLEFDLLFERFLNPERVSMPDFDIDFCMDGRDRVIEYVAQKYGREKVSQIITYGTMAAKAVVRDVGRVLGQPYGFVDRIAKLIPFEIGMTLDKALEDSEELAESYRKETDVRDLLDLAKRLEGLARNAGKHAGGVVIAPSELSDFTPVYCEEGGAGLVTQLDKDDVESIGLVKFDFLGLRTLTIIDHAIKRINRRRQTSGEALLDITELPLNDVATFKLLQACATTAVFQLESRGMKDLIKRLQPDCFDDIVALVALFRPGPLQSGMVEDFIDRKHGRAKVEYPHPAIVPVLKPTYGVILYQEQVMQIAQVLAGYTLGGADLLRRAMGKKKPEEMAKQREIFVEGSKNNQVDLNVATYIFDLMEKFAGYGFNKSHSAAYALLSYQTAWLKAHYPAAFMASVLSADLDNTDKIVTLIDECEHMELKVVPPDINASDYAFNDFGDDTIIYGLGAIKGVGQAAIDVLLQERKANGAFADLSELCRRIDSQKVNRRVLEALIRAGALDGLESNRAKLLQNLPEVMRAAEQHHRDAAAGQNDLFGCMTDKPSLNVVLVDCDPWDESLRLQHEKETLGLYLTGHPINRHLDELARMTSGRIHALCQQVEANGPGKRNEQRVRLAGLMVMMRVRNTQSGRMAFATLDDRSGRVDVLIGVDLFQQVGALLAKDSILVVEGDLGIDDFSGGFRIRAQRVFDMDEARNAFAKSLTLNVKGSNTAATLAKDLPGLLQTYKNGQCPVAIEYQRADVSAKINLGEGWRIKPDSRLIDQLSNLLGGDCVRISY